MDRSIIENFSKGGETLRNAIAGLSPSDLSWVPPKDAGIGLWSIQQVVIHLADAEAALADRIKRVVATDEPSLLAWDENKFAEKLHYDQQSAEDAGAIIDLTRRQVARVLRQLPDDAFARAGMHSERGRQTLLDIVNMANSHLANHLKFVGQKRTKLGK